METKCQHQCEHYDDKTYKCYKCDKILCAEHSYYLNNPLTPEERDDTFCAVCVSKIEPPIPEKSVFQLIKENPLGLFKLILKLLAMIGLFLVVAVCASKIEPPNPEKSVFQFIKENPLDLFKLILTFTMTGLFLVV